MVHLDRIYRAVSDGWLKVPGYFDIEINGYACGKYLNSLILDTTTGKAEVFTDRPTNKYAYVIQFKDVTDEGKKYLQHLAKIKKSCMGEWKYQETNSKLKLEGTPNCSISHTTQNEKVQEVFLEIIYSFVYSKHMNSEEGFETMFRKFETMFRQRDSFHLEEIEFDFYYQELENFLYECELPILEKCGEHFKEMLKKYEMQETYSVLYPEELPEGKRVREFVEQKFQKQKNLLATLFETSISGIKDQLIEKLDNDKELIQTLNDDHNLIKQEIYIGDKEKVMSKLTEFLKGRDEEEIVEFCRIYNRIRKYHKSFEDRMIREDNEDALRMIFEKFFVKEEDKENWAPYVDSYNYILRRIENKIGITDLKDVFEREYKKIKQHRKENFETRIELARQNKRYSDIETSFNDDFFSEHFRIMHAEKLSVIKSKPHLQFLEKLIISQKKTKDSLISTQTTHCDERLQKIKEQDGKMTLGEEENLKQNVKDFLNTTENLPVTRVYYKNGTQIKISTYPIFACERGGNWGEFNVTKQTLQKSIQNVPEKKMKVYYDFEDNSIEDKTQNRLIQNIQHNKYVQITVKPENKYSVITVN